MNLSLFKYIPNQLATQTMHQKVLLHKERKNLNNNKKKRLEN